MQEWNGRILGIGGGGFSASLGGLHSTEAVAQGFVAITTDSGHASGAEATSDVSWVTKRPGNLDLSLIEDWASRTLGELSEIGKTVTRDFYGTSATHSYFTGCSGGRRQAMQLAQMFPNAFDGILAAAPAIYIETFLVSAYLPALLMDQMGVRPLPCEIEAFTQAALRKCDKVDGLEDGIITSPVDCIFDAKEVVGQNFSCDGLPKSFTEAGARLVNAAWNGLETPGGLSWYGLNVGAELSESVLFTKCDPQVDEDCTEPAAPPLIRAFISNFVAGDPNYDIKAMSLKDFYSILTKSIRRYRHWIGAANPRLSRFHKAGGKMISWHGTADEVIPTRGSSQYYDQVLAHNANVSDFYRHFEAPGVAHCTPGAGLMPNAALEQLIRWVENGTAPATLLAYSERSGSQRPLCPYPQRQVYRGGQANETTSFTCLSE